MNVYDVLSAEFADWASMLIGLGGVGIIIGVSLMVLRYGYHLVLDLTMDGKHRGRGSND